jgi:hypothetical protein
MRALSDLLHELEGLGIQLAVNGDKLKITGVRGALTAELRQELAINKPAIIEVLRQQKGKDNAVANGFVEKIEEAKHWGDLDKLLEAIEAAYQRKYIDQAAAEAKTQQAAQRAKELPAEFQETSSLKLGELFKDAPIRRLHSKVLGEEVLLAAHDAQISSDNTLVVYQQAELRQITGMPAEQLRKVHQAKQSGFDFELIDEDDEDETYEIYVSDLLASKKLDTTCFACGQEVWWWDRLGNRKCGVCHPRPTIGQAA